MAQETGAFYHGKELPDIPGTDPVETYRLFPFNRNIRLTEDGQSIVKIRPHDADTQAIAEYYDSLASMGLSLGTRPKFSRSPRGEVLETSDFIAAPNDAYLLQHAQESEVVRYYRGTILDTIGRVIEAAPVRDAGLLGVSIDPIPHNFVEGRYIDYDPKVLDLDEFPDRILDPKQLWNYALVKTARLRPELFDALYAQTLVYLDENGFSDSADYLRARPYGDAWQPIDEKLDTDPGIGFIDTTNVVFDVDPYTQGDDLIGLLCLFAGRMTPEQQQIATEILGVKVSDSPGRAIVENVSYSTKPNPTAFRKKVLEVASILFRADQYKDFDIGEYRQRLHGIENSVRQNASALEIEGTILNVGSLVREKISAFSDLDYVYFSNGNGSDTIALIESLGGILTDQELSQLDELSKGTIDETKIKLDVDGVKVSIQIVDAGIEDIIVSGEPQVLKGYPPASRVAKDLDGKTYTIHLSETEHDFTWRLATDTEIMGPLIDNILMSWVTYQNDTEGELLIRNTWNMVARKIKQHTGLPCPSFNYLLKCLYYDHERYFTDDTFEYFRNRWESAVTNTRVSRDIYTSN